MPATSTIVAGAIVLPALTAAQTTAAASCLRDTGYWVLRGSATGRWLSWAEGIVGPEMQLVWPAGYRARFTPLLDVLAPDGTVIAREGAPITTACELGPRLVYPDGLIPPNIAPTPVGGLPEATLTPVMQWPTSAVQSLEPGFAIFGPASAGTIGAAGDRLAGRREERVAQVDGPVKVEDVAAVQAIGPPRQPPMRSSVQDQR
ncbi:MAG TPA: hypothetical protein VF302_06485 [Candidatus Limnocylindrales bacterium]